MRSIPSNFWDWAATLNGDERLVVLAIAIGGVVLITIAVCTMVYSISRTRAEIGLKRELLDRGLNADEIALIMSKPEQKRGFFRRA